MLSPGDVLGIYIEGILGKDDRIPPVNYSGSENTPPSLGYPIPIRPDGTISLPLIDPPKVAGLTLQQAEQRVVEAYTIDRPLLSPGEQRILLSMVRPAQIQVFVFREDLEQTKSSDRNLQSEGNRILTLAKHQADVLTALAKTGGLPKTSVEEIVIQRRIQEGTGKNSVRVDTIRIPLRYPSGEQPEVSNSDITLRNKDILILRPRIVDNSNATLPDQAAVDHSSGRNLHSPSATNPTLEAAPNSKADPTITRTNWKVTLDEAIHLAFSNKRVMQTLGVKREGVSLHGKVLLDRRHSDQASTDVAITVRNFVFEVSQAYWDLYFHYHNLDAARTGFDSAQQIWQEARERLDRQLAGGEASQEAQARAQYFAFKSRLQQAKSDLHHSESRLRYLLGVSSADGRLMQPVDNPSKARVSFEWEEIRRESFNASPELNRQRSRIRLHKQESLTAKQKLWPHITEKNLQQLIDIEEDDLAWKNVPRLSVEVRGQLEQLRNSELQLRRAKKRLEDEQLELAHQLSAAVRRHKDRYALAQTQFNALKAARDQVTAALTGYRVAENVPLDVVLDAQNRQMQTEIDYFRALTEYQIANDEIHYRKGSLLPTLGVEVKTATQPELKPTEPSNVFLSRAEATSDLRHTWFVVESLDC